MNPALEWLLSAAIRAPSGDNMQPWHFEVDPATEGITFFVDPARDPSPMNAAQRMSRVALGAALENLLRTAQRNGWEVRLNEPAPPAVVAVQVHATDPGSRAIDSAIANRVTNRQVYDGQPVVDTVLQRLKADTPLLDGAATQWLVERERLPALANLIGRADAMMFGEPSMRRAFWANIRFDAPTDAEVEEGLSLASLELAAGERIALRMLAWLPNWLLRIGGGLRAFAARARLLVGSAAGLCLVLAPNRISAIDDVTVGRAMQRAWLALTEQGLAAQPMMTLPVLENVLDNGTPDLIESLRRRGVDDLLQEMRRLMPEIAEARLAYLLRFGKAPAPSGRTGRLPLARVVKWL
jgi:nitroreductase